MSEEHLDPDLHLHPHDPSDRAQRRPQVQNKKLESKEIPSQSEQQDLSERVAELAAKFEEGRLAGLREAQSEDERAFPAMRVLPNGGALLVPGMTLRDYFAAQALTGLLAMRHAEGLDLSSANCDWLCRKAHSLALLMMAERPRP
jgi:hypothetical protein